MSKETTIKPGTLVFSAAGQRGVYIGNVDGDHVVQAEIECYDEWSESPRTAFQGLAVWPAVYTRKPVAVLDAEMQQLAAEITAAREFLGTIQQQTREDEAASKAMMKRIKAVEPLRLIDDFIAGKITHFVVDDNYYGISIKTAEETLATTDGGERWNSQKKMCLLTLYGGANGNLAWGLSKYSDGSDNNKTEVFPCTSLEMAQTEAAKRIAAAFETFRKIPDRPWSWVSVADNAVKLGIPVPPDFAKVVAEYRRKSAAEALVKAREQLAKAEQKVSELSAQAEVSP